MKKITALLLMLALAIGILAGCGDPKPPAGGEDGPTVPDDPHRPDGGGSSLIDKIPDGMTGKDVAKLLLAGERLGDKIIDGESIFENGVETFRHLATVAEENGRIALGGRKTPFLGGEDKVGDVEVTTGGNVYTEFDPISRNYEEFASFTAQIIDSAESAAADIDYVKKHVRLLDVWVTGGYVQGVRYFLHVDENSETIITDSEHGFSVCRRYKNDAGDDVYETYSSSNNGNFNTRASYIKDKKYELTLNDATRERYQGICASNDKGYWEIIDFVSDEEWVEHQFSIGFIVMKEDICYRAYCNYVTGAVTGYSITTADRSCDILNVFAHGDNQMAFDFNLAAFTGYDKVVTTEGGLGTLYLSNGKLLDYDNDINCTGKDYVAWLNGVTASTSAFGSEGSVLLNIVADGLAECREVLLDIFADYGLECKYDMREIYDRIDRATLEAENAINYMTWNGHRIKDEAGLLAAVAVEKQKFASMVEEYTSREGISEVDLSDETYELLINFAEASLSSGGNSSYSETKLSVDGISLTLTDTVLIVKDEPYRIAFALKSEADGSLVHLDSTAESTPYSGSGSLVVSSGTLSLGIPVLSEGRYTLVAYIATSDGIRSSATVELPVASVDTSKVRIGNIEMSAISEDGGLVISYVPNYDATVDLVSGEVLGYAGFYELVAAAVYRFGEPSKGLIESVSDDGTAAPLTGEESEIAAGCYRLSYSIENGENSAEGYVYVNYSVGLGEPDLPADPGIPEDLVKPVTPETPAQ